MLVAAYPGGSFFQGLARPWMGMHTIDIVRRDAVGLHVSFETHPAEDSRKAKVILHQSHNYRQCRIVYEINMELDVIEQITFSYTGEPGSQRDGQIRFSYLQEIDQAGDEFAEPPEIKTTGIPQQKSMGELWLMKLADGTLGEIKDP